jgi:hypothetical protein
VDDQHPTLARSFKQGAAGSNGRGQQGHVVSEALAEAAGLQKVTLHIND